MALYFRSISANGALLFANPFAGLNPVTQNQAPTANNQNFSISETAQNGAVVGQFVAADSDGSVVGHSISGSVFAISNTGAITLANNAGLVAGTPITATVTFTDDDGDSGTATVTVNVSSSNPDLPVITSPQPLIVVIPADYSKLMSSHIAVQRWIKQWSAVDSDNNSIELVFNIPQIMSVNDSPIQVSVVAIDSQNRVQASASSISIQLLSDAGSLPLVVGGTPDKYEQRGNRYYQVEE